jgi:uncharacterized protein (DUF2141 family)
MVGGKGGSLAGKRPMWLAAAICLAVLPCPAAAAELRVAVEGIRSSHGMVMIGLYDSQATFAQAVKATTSQDFLVDPQRFGAVALRANAAMRSGVVFTNLAPGRYAAVAFHDENGNSRLDKSLLGMPTEPYGFSNNVEGFLGPPTFDAAAVAIGDGNAAIRIVLVNP